MGQESKWAKGQDGLLLFTPWKNRTNSEQQEKQMAGSKWAKKQDGLLLFPPERVELTANSKNEKVAGSKWAKVPDRLLLFTPERVELTVNSKKNKWQGQNGPRVKMSQGSRWTPVVYSLKESNWQWTARKKQVAGSKWAKDHNGLLLFTPWKSRTNNEQQERNTWQSQNGPSFKMGYCCLPPERVELTVNCKEGTNGRVKMGQESRWAAVVEIGCQNNRVKLSQKESAWVWIKLGLAHFDSESSWAWPILTRSQIGPRSQYRTEQLFSNTMTSP